jgi:hypothetical protein
MKWQVCSLVLLAGLTGLGLAACSGDDGEPDTGCATAESVVLDQISTRVNPAVKGEFALAEGSSVPAEEHGSGYIVAASIKAKGIDVGFGYWWVSDLSGAAEEVLWASPFADQFTTWPPATSLKPPVDPDGADIDAARTCLGGS